MTDREVLSRYLDGELTGSECRDVEARLAAEPALAAELEALRDLLRAAAALPRRIEAPAGAWSALRSRLEEEGAEDGRPAAGGVRRPSPLLAAALVIVVLAGGFLLGRRETRRGAGEIASRVPATAVTPAPPTEKEWSDASRAVFAAREASGTTMDPADETALRENLEIIETAVRRIHAALEEDPSNASLQRLLNAEYRRRSALLRRAAQDPLMRT